MWSLKADGAFAQREARMQADSTVIVFENGCGFSEATLMRRAEPSAHIVATGDIIPDQARMVFQSGVDEIVLDDEQLVRYGSEAWQHALQRSVTSLYAGRSVSRLSANLPLWLRDESITNKQAIAAFS